MWIKHWKGFKVQRIKSFYNPWKKTSDEDLEDQKEIETIGTD
jgi:hypothetical protein